MYKISFIYHTVRQFCQNIWFYIGWFIVNLLLQGMILKLHHTDLSEQVQMDLEKYQPFFSLNLSEKLKSISSVTRDGNFLKFPSCLDLVLFSKFTSVVVRLVSQGFGVTQIVLFRIIICEKILILVQSFFSNEFFFQHTFRISLTCLKTKIKGYAWWRDSSLTYKS